MIDASVCKRGDVLLLRYWQAFAIRIGSSSTRPQASHERKPQNPLTKRYFGLEEVSRPDETRRHAPDPYHAQLHCRQGGIRFPKGRAEMLHCVQHDMQERQAASCQVAPLTMSHPDDCGGRIPTPLLHGWYGPLVEGGGSRITSEMT